MNRWFPQCLAQFAPLFPWGRNTRLLLCFVAAAPCSVAAIPTGARSDATPLSAAERDFVSSAEPLFKEFCFDCHSDKKAKAEVNLQRMSIDPDFAGLFKTWEKVIARLEQKEMPPEEEPQPTDAQRRKLIIGLRGGLDRFIRETAGDPGRVVLRKLTSAEYAYTIRDLTGLDLELEKHFDIDPAGGEGFSNIGDVQFIQDSTLERYLEAAKTVADHAVIGAGPVQFYRDPGKTGQELSAINRIRRIYEQHGFRTGAGEGAIAFGLDHYPKAFFASWRYEHRRELGLRNVTLAKLARDEGLDAPFVEHVWSVLHDPSLSFAAAEIATAWRKLPAPASRDAKIQDEVRAQCNALYKSLREWQSAFAANTGSDEEVPVLSENSFRPTLKHSFRALVNWPRGATNASFEIVAMPAGGEGAKSAVVIWRQPGIRFRQPGARGVGGGGRGRGGGTPLRQVVSAASAQQLKFGQAVNGASPGTNDFATVGAVTLLIEFPVPAEAIGANVTVDVELDLEHGDDTLVRCAISSKVIEGQGQTAAATGVVSALLANPDSPQLNTWKAGAVELARKLPQVSHREAAPADRDPIPPPWDNSYNNAERNDFHYQIKYHRDDRFLTERILDANTRAQLDQAWTDLLTSFGYHDTFIRFVARKYKLDLGDRTVANLTPEWVDQIPDEPRSFIKPLHDEHTSIQRALKAAQPTHIENTLRFAQLAWRRPLSDAENNRLRSFYSTMRDDAKLDHPEAIRALLARILMAPAFLYRVESPNRAGPGAPVTIVQKGRGIVPLSDWELASRLSYFVWSSIPDEELSRAAAARELRKPEQLARQAQRMLRDPKARRFATEFFGQWFGFYRFTEHRGVDTTRFTEFTDTLKSSMYDEAVSFFEHVVREDQPVQDILFANYSFLNHDLAKHYGIDSPVVPTNGIARIAGAGQFHRGGLLRLGAVLTATSAPLRTSAVKRGDWVLRRVLGTPIPPPPGDAGSIPPDDVLADGKTVRQRLEAHRRDASCVNCHSRIDPLGFALEHFDSIGRWRETYRDGQAIDATGTLNDGTVISELDGLMEYLRKQQSSFHRNLSSKLLGYALGRSEMLSDKPLLDQMVASLKNDSRFSTLVVQIVRSPQFRFQRWQEVEGESPETAAAAQSGRSAPRLR